MKSFKKFLEERYTAGTKLNFGATAYGNADIDKTTASEIQRGILKPEWQYMGNRGNKLTPAYSIANNFLPHGTIVKITDTRTGQPVGSKFGNTEGVYKVEDTGGKNVSRNIDFYSGSNKEMMNYFANYGKNTNNLSVEILNIKPGSPEEQQILAKLKTGQPGLPGETNDSSASLSGGGRPVYNTVSDALGGLKQGTEMISRLGMGGGIK